MAKPLVSIILVTFLLLWAGALAGDNPTTACFATVIFGGVVFISIDYLEHPESFQSIIPVRFPEYATIHQEWIAKLPFMPRGQYVYLIRDIDMTGRYKIGRTNNPIDRMHIFEVKLPFSIHIVHIIPSLDCIQLEAWLHQRFANSRIKGTEWFSLTDKDVAWIMETYTVNGHSADGAKGSE